MIAGDASFPVVHHRASGGVVSKPAYLLKSSSTPPSILPAPGIGFVVASLRHTSPAQHGSV